MYSRKSLMGWS